MSVSRRVVLGAGLGVAGLSAAAIASASAFGAPAASPVAKAPAPPTRARFAGSIGATFSAASASATHRIVLSAIDDLSPAIAGQNENRFALAFSAPAAAGEDLYSLTSEGIAESFLLLQAVVADDGSTLLRAVVNSPV